MDNPVECGVVKCVLMLSVMLALAPGRGSAATTKSGDASITINDQSQSIDIATNGIEEQIGLVNGRYLLRSFRSHTAKQSFLSDTPAPGEFRITVNGTMVDGGSGGWTWSAANATVLKQGEIEAVVKLQGKMLEIEKHYCVYPGTSIIREWVVFKNTQNEAVEIEDPYLLANRLLTNSTALQTLYYMAGGGSFSGSQVLHHVALTDSYARSFDTKDKPEVEKVQGIEYDMSMPYGSGRYMPWFGVTNQESNGGLFVGFDYYGHWIAEIGKAHDSPRSLAVRLAGYKRKLQPGESIETPKAFTGVWTGDLDDMGNQLKNWQYQYLWDYTNDHYFGKIRYAAEMRWQPQKGGEWGGGTEDNWDFRMSAMFHAADVIRYVGADILWQDAGWHDNLGDNDGPDFREIQRYIAKSGVRLAVWWPLWYAERKSKVLREHPDWGTGGVFQGPMDAARPEVIQWMTDQLEKKAAQWGDFQWREDGSAVYPVANDETPMLDQYHNIIQMQKQFRGHHPDSSIDLCSGGGNLMSYEGLRLADVSQLTDGGSLTYGNYYSSYLFPPDKIDEWTRTQNTTPVNIATTLTMAPAWMGDRGLYNHEPGMLLDNGRENLRKTFEIYHYLTREGVAGRWVQIYHPKVEGDDPVYYLERLSRDGHRGVVVLKHFTQGQVHIYPKGLHPGETYDVQFQIAKSHLRRTGEDIERNGITLLNPDRLELIYLGLPNHPGSGSDSTPPSAPGNVIKRVDTNLGVTGVELHWSPATDNNWLSYYQIYRDGKPIDRVSTGTFYFDHSLEANGDCEYGVQAVDGDGNGSPTVTASVSGGNAEIYTAWGGYLAGKDYSYQGANHWTYEGWNGTKRIAAQWNGSLGQEGLYQGTAEEHLMLMGATWMRPGDHEDAVRIFTLPESGEITVTGSVHKDIYHLHGDGVRVKIMKGDEQLWPEHGWTTIGASDIQGTQYKLSFPAKAGDQLFFIVNCNTDAIDDETVWNPEIRYAAPPHRAANDSPTIVDDVDNSIAYSGDGWRTEGVPPWSKGAGIGGDIGYLTGTYKGTLTVSGTAGDEMKVRFRGTGIHVIGETGSDCGKAEIKIDGVDKGVIDTFVPEDYPNFSPATSSTIRKANDVPFDPPGVLWGTSGLAEGEHTLEIVVSGRKNSDSQGTFVGIDGLVIDGTLASKSGER